jgi:hypothetical protein
MNQELLRYVRKEQSRYPFIGIKFCVESYRRTKRVPKFAFLADVQSWSIGDTFTGEVDGVTVKVQYVYDDDSRLGDDDVTGTFGNLDAPDALQYSGYGSNGRGCKWYYPANTRNDPEAREWDWKHHGASKQVCAEIFAAAIRQDMADDADRSFIVVIATVSVAGVELGSSSLGGVDMIERYDGREYMIDVAEECIAEAMDEARDHINAVIQTTKIKAFQTTTALETARETLKA